jgi:hypothetical protein
VAAARARGHQRQDGWAMLAIGLVILSIGVQFASKMWPMALGQAFASWGILRRVACGGHPLQRSTTSKSTPAVTSFLLTVSWSGRATLSTGFRGGEQWSLCATPAPSLSHFWAGPSVRVGLVCLTMGRRAFACAARSSLLAVSPRRTRRVPAFHPASRIEDQSLPWG